MVCRSEDVAANDRVVSEYCYRRRRFESGEANPHLVNLAQPFDDWVSATYERGDFRTQAFFDETGASFNARNMVDGNLIWFLPQRRWLCDVQGMMLADHVLRFETLEADWRQFAEAFDINTSLAHINASPAPAQVLDRFSQRVRDVVFEYFREDFETFGYPR